MEKKYTVEEFVQLFIKRELNLDDFSEQIKTCYIPFVEKVAKANMIMESTYYRVVNGIKEFYVNSPANYMLICLNLVDLYSSIKVDFKNTLTEFDLLNKNGILDWVISCIPEKELKEFKMICEMVIDDEIQNQHEIHKYITEQVERFTELFKNLLVPIIEQIDIDKIEKLLDKE